MKAITLADTRNAFAYPIGMLIIVMNEIDTMMVTGHRIIYGSGQLASKSFVKLVLAKKIETVITFVKDKDPNRTHLGAILHEVSEMLWVRNALAHGFICGGGESPSYLTLAAFRHEKNFSPESLIEHVQKAMDLSSKVSEALNMIKLYDLAMERQNLSKSTNIANNS